jgi:type IV pilus assembly protein PilQ
VKPVAEAPKPEPVKPAVEAPKPEPVRTAAQAKPDVEKPSTSQVPTQPEKSYTGRPVTFDFAGADLRAVLRTFSEPEISGLNVVIDPTIQGTVDVSLRDVPWDQALEIILRANKLGYVIENNVVRIAPLKALAEEETERRKLAEEQAKSGQLRVLTRTLSYAKATNIAKLLKDARVITDRGTAFVDERSNTLIVNDLPDALAACDDLINTLDRAEPQVEIEARIVQTTRDSARALGVQWGVNGRMASELGNTSPLRFPATGSVSGRTGNTQNSPVGAVRETSPTGVNLPVTGATTAVGLAMGTLNGSFNLDVALSAIEKNGHGKILSTPRVMMQNNVEAEMMQGIQIPIQTVSNNTVTVTFKDAALQLRVKPQITAANTVILDLNLENASPDYSREVNGIPPIDTQRAKTQVLVQDSETMVIGGIFVTRETGSTDKVPYLHRIPLFGWLFKRDINSGEDRELLIFITPRIRR